MNPALLPLLPAALAAPALDCRLPDALDALRGVDVQAVDAAVRHPRPGPGLLRADAPPPPPDGKPVYGTAYDHAIESDNFVVTWWDPAVDREAAELTSEVLENAWTTLVEEQGWPAPDSSDTFLLWVILDLDLSGTGITYELDTDEYPAGYPVIYVNPYYAWDEPFYRNLVAHEFAHAIQYAMRDWDGSDGESWYWEASAQWAAERAAPGVDGHHSSSAYYADRPWYRFDSMSDSHQYGMFVLNAWLEEQHGDDDTMRQVWLEGADRAGEPWDAVLEAATGTDAADLWGGFTAAMSNETLSESADYADVLVDGGLRDGQEGAVAYLGTDYFRAEDDHTLEVSSPGGDDVIVSGPQGHGTRIQVRAGEIIGVIGLESTGTASYAFALSEPGEEGGDEGGGEGGGDEGGGDEGGDDGLAFDTAEPDDDDDDDDEKGGAGCTAVGPALPMTLWLGGLGLVAARRRR